MKLAVRVAMTPKFEICSIPFTLSPLSFRTRIRFRYLLPKSLTPFGLEVSDEFRHRLLFVTDHLYSLHYLQWDFCYISIKHTNN